MQYSANETTANHAIQDGIPPATQHNVQLNIILLMWIQHKKQIPSDIPHPGLAKLDMALRFVLKAYADANNGKQPSARLIEQIKQGIQIKHDELDRYGGLNSITTPSTRELQS